MRWRELAAPSRMQRVALVAPTTTLRDLLVRVADAGTVELDRADATRNGVAVAPSESSSPPRISLVEPDVEELRGAGRADLVAGEAALRERAHDAVTRGEVAALAGWMPADEVGALAEAVARVGGAVVPLRATRGVDPPTLLVGGAGVRGSLSSLVQTYGTVPYADVDPSALAGLAYMFMFGMMFGDAGHGSLLVLGGLLLRTGRPARLAGARKAWPFVVGSGVVAVLFGFLYGEFFGPTGVIPVLWIRPLESPLTLMAVALGVGFVLLAGAQLIGTVNRWREGGWPLALGSTSGIAGAALLAGLGLVVLGVTAGLTWSVVLGALVAVGGVGLAYVGFLASAGGGATGVGQATVEVFDAVIRVGTNTLSFVRLAAFGLTHAAIGAIVWGATVSLWAGGGAGLLAAVAVFVVGNAVAFSLEAVVAGVQALRLEYYELFSRVFVSEGRPFRPWHVPTDIGPDAPPTPDRIPTGTLQRSHP